ncbi:hypothetical protein EMPS_04345 [Entomortierella parvispora]|uniref:Uncharacterized protein n=1 Tax=Entomortierella parvispora TaxID=205924 RepID=A0A9P3H8I4_9FUNG|nr:hypothetical protein EMPS_04345 [Entomortierella parvispora]
MVATYIRLSVLAAGQMELRWADYTQIIVNVIFFLVTCHGAFGKSWGVPRFLRAFLLFALAVLLLYVNLESVHLAIQFPVLGFGCDSNAFCELFWANVFASIINGFFVIFDVILTLIVGPLESTQASVAPVKVV